MYSVKRYLNRLTLTEPLTSTLCSVPPSGSARIKRIGGFPHSEIVGSKVAHTSPTLIAACHVLHRLYMPRHPRIALTSRLRAHTTTINAGLVLRQSRLGRAALGSFYGVVIKYSARYCELPACPFDLALQPRLTFKADTFTASILKTHSQCQR